MGETKTLKVDAATPSPSNGRERVGVRVKRSSDAHETQTANAELPLTLPSHPRGGEGSQTTRAAPLVLWRIAQTFLHTLYALFGDPAAIAFQHTLTKPPRDLLLSWVRCGEAMMRRLLLIEAAAYPKPNTPPRLWPKRARVRRLIGFDDDKPETWRVSLRCFAALNSSPARGGSGSSRRSRQAKADETKGGVDACAQWFTAKPAKFYSSWPLAERYEALLRVFNDPAPFARRLAKRLHALRHRLMEILRAPPEAERRIERFEALTHAASARWRIPNTS